MGLGAAGLPLGVWACSPERRERPARPGGPNPITRPVLRPWADDIVHMVAPPGELPVAYVSMALRQVYVDSEYRDRAAWLLRAHISVSTLLWRIPLPGDPEGQPVVPGDERREFEELPMRAWNPSLRPAMDDIRIVRGEPVRRRADFACVPLVDEGPAYPLTASAATEERWVSAEPFDITVAAGPVPGGPTVAETGAASEAGTVREDFGLVGTALRFQERECAAAGEAVQLVSWVSSAPSGST